MDKFGLRPHIRFGAEVTGAEYDEQAAAWRVSTTDGGVLHGRALIAGLGPLHLPSIPELPGLERFEGRAFHSAQWDHDYDLSGKRVAVIGTGASAIQFVPQIAARTKHLTVFQRTAPWILPRPDREFTQEQQRRFERVPGARFAYRNMIYWLQESFVLGFEHPKMIKGAERLGRWHLERQVHGRRAAAQAHPRLHPRLQADAGLQRLLPGIQPAWRRAGDRRHRRDPRAVHRDQGRPRDRGGRDHLRHRLPRHRRAWPTCTSSAGTG